VTRYTPYVPSPLLSGSRLYFLKSNSDILTCLDIHTGKPHYAAQRIGQIGSDVYASPVAAGGHVYLVGRNGTTVVSNSGAANPTLTLVALSLRLSDRLKAVLA
jgi:outer membrane protein assembly factor BamB